MDSSLKLSHTLAHIKLMHKYTYKIKHFQREGPNILGFTVELRTARIELKLFLVVFKLKYWVTILICQMNFSHHTSFKSKKQYF